MVYVYATLLVMVNFVWLLLNLLGLPGNWLIVITTAIVLWAQRESPGALFSLRTVLVITVLAALGEVLELAAGAIGARQAGATRRASLGALAGGLIGAIAGTFLIPVPVVGSIIGACGGAFLGALYLELYGGRSLEASVRSGVGAGAGRLVGTLVKIGAGAAIWVVTAVAAFWP